MLNKQTIGSIFEIALDQGADFGEVFVENKYNTNILMDNDRIENGIVAKDYGVGIRVIYGNCYGYT